MPFMDESDLVRKLESHDSSVRFVPFGFKVEEMSSADLARNNYIIGLAGQEGAEKLAEVAGKFKQKPYLWSFASVDNQIMRVSALNSFWNLDHWLNILGGSNGGDRVGCSFGVRKTGEARRPKNKLY